MKKSIFIIALLMLSIAYAQPNLQPQHQFWGKVKVNSLTATDGLIVEAFYNGASVGSTLTSSGSYSLKVSHYSGSLTGKIVNFSIAGKDTGESSVVTSFPSVVTELDLDVAGDLGVCGDFICSGGESCSSCTGDCGACAEPVAAVGGGGGGGGGAFFLPRNTSETEVATCEPNWQCSGWPECIGGKQTRICTDANSCEVDDGKPEENRDCEILPEFHSAEPAAPVITEEAVSKEQGFGAITGAVIGAARGNPARTIVLLLALVVLVALAINMFKKK